MFLGLHVNCSLHMSIALLRAFFSFKIEMDNENSANCKKIRRQSQYLSFNLDYLNIEDEPICHKYTQVRGFITKQLHYIDFLNKHYYLVDIPNQNKNSNLFIS